MYVSVFLGPQGAGKDTQARLLEKQGIIKSFSVGDILREAGKSDKALQALLDAGQLVPSDKLSKVLSDFFKNKTFSQNLKHIVLTGFPREVSQIYILVDLMKVTGWEFGLLFNLKLDRRTVLERISSRYICPKCGAVYNLKTNPPKHGLVCDYDGTKLIKRTDDQNVEAITTRLNRFDTQSVPVINLFRKYGCVVDIDANRSIDDIYRDILHVFYKFPEYKQKCRFNDLAKSL